MSNATQPPLEPASDIEVSPGQWADREFYHLMTALVIPRPIGWISTVSAAGVRNLAPYSYFNLMGSNPPYVAFGSGGVKDSLANLREVPEFVANIVSVDLIEKMNFTSGDFPREEDEFGWAGLTPAPSAKVRPARVAEARAHLECVVQHVHSDGHTHIVLAKVVHAHVDRHVWKEGRVDPRRLDPACRLSGSWYAGLGELVSVPRPEWKVVKETNGQEAMPRITGTR
jgi:flavin reductase (DIM6/NTAB) family NADH-FMN oxidoreductase RutF